MDDFERRRELRRQKREELRQEAERLSYERNDDDEEEAARERRRRARQERLRLQKEDDGESPVTEKTEVNAQNSVAEEVTQTTMTKTIEVSTDEEAALLERLAKREERRQRRLQEALERQRELDPTITDETLTQPTRNQNNEVEENETAVKNEKATTRRGFEFEEIETITKSSERNDWRQEEEKKQEIYDSKEEEKAEPGISEENQVRDERASRDKTPKDEVKPSWDRRKGIPETKAQNGESIHGFAVHKLKHTEKTFSTTSEKGHLDAEEVDAVPKVEAGKRLEELRRRRGETETEEFEKMKHKQQQAAAELEELKKKREERKKVLEEEEQRRKQEQAQQKAKDEEEKRRLKEEIEKRRAEAAEKRQKMPEDGLPEEKKPFKCFTPKGSSLKIEERAEFLNKSAQKSGAKASHPTPAVSKIDSRLEQYTSAIEGTKSTRPAKGGASDLPLPAEGVRNIKNMWEKGNVFSSPGGTGTPNKEAAGLKVGVSSRINDWLTKTPESNKSPPAKPSDLKPGDVSGKRNLWEKQTTEKHGSSTKMTAVGKSKADSNGLRQYEKDS